MGRLFKNEMLKRDIDDLSEQLEAMEKRYKAVLDNLVGNDTKANRRAEKILSENIDSIKKRIVELKTEEHEKK